MNNEHKRYKTKHYRPTKELNEVIRTKNYERCLNLNSLYEYM